MQYVSTRGAALTLGFTDALLTGLARDGGLYAPLSLPQWSPESIRSLSGLDYAETACRVTAPFVGGEFGASELKAITADAYSGFRRAATAPLAQIDSNLVCAGALPRSDVGVQGFRHAMARPSDESRARPARRAQRVGDLNLKCRTPGSMTLLRLAWARAGSPARSATRRAEKTCPSSTPANTPNTYDSGARPVILASHSACGAALHIPR